MASEIKVDTIVNAGGDNDSGIDLATNDQVKVKIANAEDFIFKANSLEVQTGSNIDMNGTELILDADGDTSIEASTDDTIVIDTGGSERARIDSSGNLLVGTTTATPASTTGVALSGSAGYVYATRDGAAPGLFNRLTSDGEIVSLRKDGTTLGSIGAYSGDLYVVNTGGVGAGLRYNSGFPNILPCNGTGADRDNAIDLGASSVRFDDVYATNGTIQTSDQNEKNTITDSDLGLDFVNRLSPKSYIFNGKTRTHYGLIAQDVETVLSDINKETSEFAGFIKSDISEEQDGSQYRYGLRYTEFVGILIKALQEADDKIDALTARVTALESE